MTLPNVQELIYQRLSAQVRALHNAVVETDIRRERSEVTGGIVSTTLALLPLVNNTGGDLYYASDGCKPGEAVGHGTGTAVYWDAATNQWLRLGDYQPPSGGTPLPVTSGGTGLSTLTAHSMLIGNGTSTILGLAPGTAINVAISNGTDWTSRALLASDLPASVVSPLTTKGDLHGFTTVDARVPAGSDNQFLVAASAQSTGLQYRTIASSDLTTALTTPPAIGGTTPAAGTFNPLVSTTTLGVTGLSTLTGGASIGANLAHTGTGIAFFNVAVQGRQTGHAWTNNITSGGTNDQADNWTSLSVYGTDAAAIRNACYQMAREIGVINAALRLYGLLT